MATEILQIDYRHIILDDESSAAAAVLNKLSAAGLSLLGFSQFPAGPGKSQLVLIAQDCERFAQVASEMGLVLSTRKTGFMIRGDENPETAVADVLKRLSGEHIGLTAMQAVSAGSGRFGALLWVKPQDIPAAAKTLGATLYLHNIVDESSEESFPASDPPSWTMSAVEK